MNIRFASALLALALPLAAQNPTPAPTQAPAPTESEAIFYKAFYLQKGQVDYAGAMVLYEQFLAKAPDHLLAKEAAKQQYRLLDITGKAKERDAFKAKYEKLIGDLTPTGPGGGDTPAGDAPRRGGGDAQGRGAGGDMTARIADVEKQLAKAKTDGDEEQVKKLTQQLERMKQAGAGGARGAAGRGQGLPTKKIAEMNADEMKQLKDSLGMMEGMVERMRERGAEDQAAKLETGLAAVKKGLDSNDLEGAQKALDELRAAMPARRGRGGEGGGPGGGGQGGDKGGNKGGGGNGAGGNGGGGSNNGGGDR